MEKEQKN